MPFYGNDFFRAVEGQPHYVVSGYMRALWHNWTHEHCQGLRNNENYLRAVCHLDPDEWEVAFGIIFDNDKFFTLGEDGLWHQTRLSNEWEMAKERYDKQCARTKAATVARWKKNGKRV